MFDIMFMRQKRNEPARLIWITSHGQFIRSVHSFKSLNKTAKGQAFREEWEVLNESKNK